MYPLVIIIIIMYIIIRATFAEVMLTTTKTFLKERLIRRYSLIWDHYTYVPFFISSLYFTSVLMVSYLFLLQLAFISFVTGWPTDTYETYWPSTFWGKASAITSSFTGYFIVSLLTPFLAVQ